MNAELRSDDDQTGRMVGQQRDTGKMASTAEVRCLRRVRPWYAPATAKALLEGNRCLGERPGNGSR